MAKTFGFSVLDKKAFNSKITSANITGKEQWLGYFMSPALAWISYYLLAGTYLNLYYTDVLKLGAVGGGLFLILLPVFSKIFDAFTNILMGQFIERTRSRQGKVRPWILLSVPLLGISGILLYTVPQASVTVQVIWVGISYNIYYALGWTIYNMSQTLLVPLATRNTRQRDKIALFQNMGMNMVPGMLTALIFPMLFLPWMGVSPEKWSLVMSIFSIIAMPGMLLQYFFTKERITEDAQLGNTVQVVSFKEQLKASFANQYWLIFMGVFILYQFSQAMNTTALIYYSNWVLGSYNDGITMTMLNAIGQLPLGIGVFLLWPLVKKIGKRKTMIAGMLLASIAFIPVIILPTNFLIVLGAIFIKSFGMLPTYLLAAFTAETLDHIEWKSGFRCDGLTATCTNIILTVMTGLSLSLFNFGLSTTGYIAPQEGVTVVQNDATQSFIVIAFAAIPALSYFIIAILMYFFKVEKLLPQISTDIVSRRKAEAEARGDVYVLPEELERIEQEKQEEVAEAKRIEELKAKCVKKGLDFSQEEAKYQEKLAKKQAKNKK